MQNLNQAPCNNSTNQSTLKLESKQVERKARPISAPAKFYKDRYSEIRRGAFKQFDDAQLFVCDETGAEVYIYTVKDFLCAAGFKAKSKNVCFRYRFQSESDRIKYINSFFDAQLDLKNTRDSARHARFNFVPNVQVGDVFYTSWGWEQTNIDFYQVVRVMNKKCVVRALRKDYKETQFMAGHSTPIVDCFKSAEFTVSIVGESILKIDRERAYLLDFDVVEGAKVFKPKYESHYA